MASKSNLDLFNKIYDETYSDILKYIIIKCHDINDANDIIQEVYLEFWKIFHDSLIDSKKQIDFNEIFFLTDKIKLTKEKFGKRAEPVYKRVLAFMKQLLNNRLISLKKPKRNKKPKKKK